LRIEGSPTQKIHREKYGAEYDYYNFAAIFNREIQKWDPDVWAKVIKRGRSKICCSDEQAPRRIHAVAERERRIPHFPRITSMLREIWWEN